MSKSRNLLAVGLLSAMFMMTGGQAYAGELADTVYYGGKIYTMTETKEEAAALQPKLAEVVAVKDGKIVFVGTKADAEAEGYFATDKVDRIVDLKNKVMYPGFIDGHSHFPNQGTDDLYKVNLNSPLYDGPVTDIASLQREIKARADLLRSQGHTTILVEGYNYDDTKLKEMRHPTAKDLDEACPDLPVFIKHISGHVGVANTKALELCKVAEAVKADPETYGGVEMENGVPTGLLNETKAMGLVTPTRAKECGNVITTMLNDGQAVVARASQIYTAAGVTTADNGGSDMRELLTWQNAILNDNLTLRLVAHPFGYFYYPGYGEFGWQNRAALGWKDAKGNVFGDADAKDFDGSERYLDGTGTPKTGADISNQVINVEYPDYQIMYPMNIGVCGKIPENRLFLGAWKFIFDGSPQAYTAWMKSPGNYDWGKHTADKSFNKAGYFNGLEGTLNMSPELLEKMIALYHQYGFSSETHTNGPGAAEAWVTAVEKAVQAYPEVEDTRTTSIHGQTLERQHIERMTGNYAELAATKDMYTDLMGAGGKAVSELGNLPELMAKQNIFCSFFNNHVYFYGDRHHDIFFGPGRAMNISPVGWAEHYGLPYSFHNDTDVTPISPLRSITTAVNRMTEGGKLLSKDGEKNINAKVTYDSRKEGDKTFDPMEFWAYDHRINALQALHGVTTGPAYQNKIDDRVGSIEVNKLADFVIMDKDILQQAEEDSSKIATMRVAATIVGDKLVHGVLPDSDAFTFGIDPGFEQPAGYRPRVEFAEVYTSQEHADELEQMKGLLPEGEVLLGALNVKAHLQDYSKARADAGGTAWADAADAAHASKCMTFSFSFLGNGDKISDLKLYKMRDTEALEYTYGHADVSKAEASGHWWIADSTNPLVALDKDAELKLDHNYLVNFVIQDNSKFDDDSDDFVIADPVALATTTGNLPDNGAKATEEANNPKSDGGSSGGCTVGTNPAYELLALLLASLGVMAGRIFRRRENA